MEWILKEERTVWGPFLDHQPAWRSERDPSVHPPASSGPTPFIHRSILTAVPPIYRKRQFSPWSTKTWLARISAPIQPGSRPFSQMSSTGGCQRTTPEDHPQGHLLCRWAFDKMIDSKTRTNAADDDVEGKQVGQMMGAAHKLSTALHSTVFDCT